MPAIRTERSVSAVKKANSPQPDKKDIHYPTSQQERGQFKTKARKRVTPHQWAVYDYVKTIPAGSVSTYKDVCTAVGGSPRSVGSALRNNPFAPYIPCHRVIASNLFIGGFFGEWGNAPGSNGENKIAMLKSEGVRFDGKGYLADRLYLHAIPAVQVESPESVA